MENEWKILKDAPEEILKELRDYSKIVANLLYHRGIKNSEEAKIFLKPNYHTNTHDPFLFTQMQKAVDRIFLAIENQEQIVIHGDYDADGVTSAAILETTIRNIGAQNVNVFIPHRESDGYGLNKNTVKNFIEQKMNLIITCDCGISNKTEVELANENGIDVIITDHHGKPKELPPAFAIIHPLLEANYPEQNLAGAGVAFKLAQALLRKHKEQGKKLVDSTSHESFEKWSLDLVAIASVADMVPLTGETRVFTKYGLIVLNKVRRMGIRKLLEESRMLDDDNTLKKELTADSIGYYIAPKLNAAGRIAHPKVAFDLLVSKRATDATDLAFLLSQHNQDRQQETEKLTTEAIKIVETEQKNKEVLCVVGDKWSSGLVGLIAGKLKERYYRPALVISNNGSLVGSGRSIDGFDMINALHQIPDFFVKFGGHPMACGFTLKNLEIIQDFQQKLIEQFLSSSAANKQKTIQIETEVYLEDMNWDVYKYLELFEPFGKENEKPLFIAKKLRVVGLESIGVGGKHIRINVKHKTNKIFKIVGWNLCNGKGTNWCNFLKKDDTIDVVFELSVNEWRGNKELQRTIVDLKKSPDHLTN